MTLNEAYNEAYSLRNTELKGRFKYNFSYWKNGSGPSEVAKIKDLLKIGSSHTSKGWKLPKNVGDWKVVNLLISKSEKVVIPKEFRKYQIDAGQFTKYYISGPDEDLEMIIKFGKPNKNK